MFRFANPEYLYFLLIIPVLVLLHFHAVHAEQRKIKQLGDPELIRLLMPDRSPRRRHIKHVLLFFSLFCAILMLARPQFGMKEETVKKNGIEMIIALDVSRSMLAEDVSPNRLERAKMLLSKLIDQFENDKVGLIVFAGDAFTQLPITSDFVSAKMFLRSLSPDMIARQGTNFQSAIELATRSFTAQEGIGKSIILITDGENHEPGAVEAAAKAREEGYTVHVLGIGSPNGAPIPDEKSGGYYQDRSGQTVITRLNEQACREISEAGKGIFARIDNSDNAQRALIKEVEKMQKAETSTRNYKEYDEQFPAMAWIILFILTLEALLLERKNPLLKNFSLFGKPFRNQGKSENNR